MATVQDYVTEALQEIGAIEAGETPNASDSAYCFTRFNRLIDRLKVEECAVPYPLVRTTFTISQVASYTVGTGATISVARPPFLDHVTYYDSSLSDPVEIPLGLLSDDQYALWAIKTEVTPYPTQAYYNPTFGSTGFATLYLLPIPSGSNLVGVIYAPSAVAEFAALTTTVSLPPGYHEMFVTNLALSIAPGFQATPSPALVERARESMATVKRANWRSQELVIEGAALVQQDTGAGLYDIRSDT